SWANVDRSATTCDPSWDIWLNAGFKYRLKALNCAAVGWATRYAPDFRNPCRAARTLGVSESNSVSRSTIPRVWVGPRVPPLEIGVPDPGVKPMNRLATPVRLSCPIVAIVPWRSG